MDPIRLLEYIGDATDNLRDARTTLAAVKRMNPTVYERMVELGIVQTIEGNIAALSKLRGGVHAETYGHAGA